MTEKKRTKFAHKALRALRREFSEHSFDYDPTGFRILSGDGVLNLTRLYEEWSSAGFFAKRGALKRLVGLFSESVETAMPDEWSEAKDKLLPRLRAATHYPLAELELRLERPDWRAPPTVPVNDELVLELCYDQPSSSASVSAEQLERWDVTFDDAMVVARRNLSVLTPDRAEPLLPHLFRSSYGDSYDATRMILTEKVAWHDAPGDPVVFVPNRSALFITGTEADEGLVALADIADDALGEDRKLSARLFRLEPGGFVPFDLPPEHPATAEFTRLRVLHEATDYDEQKALLERHHERDGNEVFVASAMLFEQEEDGRLNCVCSWPEGVHAWLPHADRIAFTQPDARAENGTAMKTVAWEDAMRVCGDLMRPLGMVPERWEVNAFPPPEALAAMPEVED